MILVQCNNCGKQAEGKVTTETPQPGFGQGVTSYGVVNGPMGWTRDVQCDECNKAVREATTKALTARKPKQEGQP